MKLRNKKTGEIEEACFAMDGGKIAVIFADMPLCGNSVLGEYGSLAELNEEWEDYVPVEPLIKDEKVRKALRNYAEVFGWKSARYSSVNNAFVNQGGMFFVRPSWELEQLEQLGYIPIDELCGTPPEPLEPTFVDLDERIKEKEEE